MTSVLFVLVCSDALADDCGSVKACAQQMVDLANALKTENVALTKRVQDLEQALNKQIGQLRNNLGSWDTNIVDENRPPAPVNDGTIKCDSGYYMVGVNFQRVSSGLNWAQAICRKLNIGG